VSRTATWPGTRWPSTEARQVAGQHCTQDLVYVSREWTLEDAAAAMVHGGFRHLVVVEGREVVGLLSMRDIVRVWSAVRRRRSKSTTKIRTRMGCRELTWSPRCPCWEPSAPEYRDYLALRQKSSLILMTRAISSFSAMIYVRKCCSSSSVPACVP
jgi:hypothetical protein